MAGGNSGTELRFEVGLVHGGPAPVAETPLDRQLRDGGLVGHMLTREPGASAVDVGTQVDVVRAHYIELIGAVLAHVGVRRRHAAAR